jgi:hypothetical protein
MDLFERKNAVLSPCGRYRYRLSRTWDGHKLPLVWIMLNPSTADAEIDDPTIRRCISFSKREGAGGLEVLNLFALRATDPKQLRIASDPIGPDNDEWIREVLHPHSRVVAAWGEHGKYLGRGAAVLKTLAASGLIVQCLGDKPRHPLYIKGDQPLQAYPPASV